MNYPPRVYARMPAIVCVIIRVHVQRKIPYCAGRGCCILRWSTRNTRWPHPAGVFNTFIMYDKTALCIATIAVYAARQGLNKNVIRTTRHFDRVTQKSRLKNPLTTHLRKRCSVRNGSGQTESKRNLKRFESISNLLFRLAQHNFSYGLAEPTATSRLISGVTIDIIWDLHFLV